MKSLLPFTIIILLLTGCKEQTENESARESTTTDDLVTTQIAMANGFNNFEDVQQLNFTFNVKVNDTLRSKDPGCGTLKKTG
jgi:hypothetical protein